MDERGEAELRRAEGRTLTVLFVCYAAYYFCRTFFASVKPLLIHQFHGVGVNKETLGLAATLGALSYALGKVSNSVVCDLVGGRRMLLLGAAGAVAFTVAFGLSSGLALFVVWWIAARFVLSMGWGGVVRIAAHWFAPARYGSVMGVLSMSYVVGEAVSRALFGWLLGCGVGWRGVCFAGAAVLAAAGAWTALRLRERPADLGLPEPSAETAGVYAGPPIVGVRGLIGPLLRSPAFWVVLSLSFGLTIIRDSFGEWLPLYLAETAGVPAGAASVWASLFPLFGAVSIFAVGHCSDRYLGRRRGGLITALLAVACGALFAMSRLGARTGALPPVALAAAVALFTMGPYSLLMGAIALDMGGRQGGATASGLVDGVGYAGGLISGLGMGALAQRMGWGAAFTTLAAACALTTAAALLYWLRFERPATQHRPPRPLA